MLEHSARRTTLEPKYVSIRGVFLLKHTTHRFSSPVILYIFPDIFELCRSKVRRGPSRARREWKGGRTRSTWQSCHMK
jgi:hypothetical protein